MPKIKKNTILLNITPKGCFWWSCWMLDASGAADGGLAKRLQCDYDDDQGDDGGLWWWWSEMYEGGRWWWEKDWLMMMMRDDDDGGRS